jgi:Na+/proline symporter
VQGSLVKRVLLQMLGVAAYFALVVILYWRALTDLGAVAIIVGLLVLFKAVVDSGGISIAQLSPLELGFNIRTPAIELFKSLSFLSLAVLDSRWH